MVDSRQRFSLVSMMVLWLTAQPILTLGQVNRVAQGPFINKSPLVAQAFYPLPLGAIKPTGWLRNQLQIQANGLTGHLDEFWPDLSANSAWRGGSGEGWERGPYYLDGLVPLAYLLADSVLIAKARPWIEWTLTHQRPDGSIGPVRNDDWWPNMIMLKVLMQYQEATGDARVIPFMKRYFAYQLTSMGKNPLREWAKYRWAEELLAIQWLYNRVPDPGLLKLADQLHRQGYNWRSQFEPFVVTRKVTRESVGLVNGVDNTEQALQTHGVNNAMALKMPTLWGFFSGNAADRKTIYKQVAALDRYHGQPTGMFSGDEHLAGRDPSQGVELCTVVEAQFSYEQLLALLGDARFGDRLEKITFNALPATLTTDMWAHQYDQQPNQVLVSDAKRNWSTNGNQSNLFGLEPHFGCCTANMHQGWPKFATHLWMSSPATKKQAAGLVAVAYAPCDVTTRVGSAGSVHLRQETDYPFRETVRITVEPNRPARFPLRLRIPSWAEKAEVRLNGVAQKGVKAGSFYAIDRAWQKGDVITLRFPMPVRATSDYHHSVVLSRGPLLFSLPIASAWRKLKDRPTLADDYEVYPEEAWNYALVLDTAQVARAVEVVEAPVGSAVFNTEQAPVFLKVSGVLLPQWTLQENSAGPLPQSPVSLPAATPALLRLIPYGSAKLRVTAFPFGQVHP